MSRSFDSKQGNSGGIGLGLDNNSCRGRCAQQISVDRAKAGQQNWGKQYNKQLERCQQPCRDSYAYEQSAADRK